MEPMQVVKKEELIKLVEEFKQEYLYTEQGQEHLEAYNKEREELKKNFKEIKEKNERGEDITDDVLYKLLPYKDTKPNREKGRRISIWAGVIDDIKKWFENAGWQKPNNWKNVANALFNLIQTLVESEDKEIHKKAIKEFVESEYSRGFQTGFITPCLYPLKNSFLVINNKIVEVVRFISKEFFGEEVEITTNLEEYIENNEKLKEFVNKLSEIVPEFSDFDKFDMFCHWMYTKKLKDRDKAKKSKSVPVPQDEKDVISLAQTADNPKFLEELYNQHKEKPRIVKEIVNNPYCPSNIKRDYLEYVVNSYLRAYSDELKTSITDWDDFLDAMNICLKAWNPLHEIAPIPEIDLEDPRMKEIFEALQNHKQVILYGPPGTSKTYYAKGLALALANDQKNIEFVQFHPSYSYEDFVEGIFPKVDEKTGQVIFKVEDKIFKKLCKEAREHPDKRYVLIIDEINRADLSKVFGEIFSALEYREETVKLLYSRESFTIPTNLYIIGTMNTLDKSTVDIDFALMRRFKFFEVRPDREILRKILNKNGMDEDLIEKVVSVFEKIQEFYPLGHAYFKDVKSKDDLKRLWEHQLSFLLKEYFTDLRKDVYDKIREIFWNELEL